MGTNCLRELVAAKAQVVVVTFFSVVRIQPSLSSAEHKEGHVPLPFLSGVISSKGPSFQELWFSSSWSLTVYLVRRYL